MKYFEIEEQDELVKLLSSNMQLKQFAFQDLDFSIPDIDLDGKIFTDCIFLGCTLPSILLPNQLLNCHIFPHINASFNSYVSKLYSADSLLGEYKLGDPNSYSKTFDKRVYDHYIREGKQADNICESLARRLHDHSITDAMYDFLAEFNEKQIVAVMGGHNLSRDDKDFADVVEISKTLTEDGYLMVSGGGPGAMEATHVGAWLAGKTKKDIKEALTILSKAPSYEDKNWLDQAFQVLKLFPSSKYRSLGIPTWLYGHEPPTPFASHIAKYFANSVREEGLLAIAKGGVIFAPGSAGTIQEIFQDATQNHYRSYGYASPMVFFNKSYWTKDRPIFPLLKQMSEDGKYEHMILSIWNSAAEVITEIKKFIKVT